MCLLDEEKVKHAEEYFEKHGAVSTFVGRLVPAVRQLISIPAGLVRMKMKRFLLFTALGAGAWNIILALLGYSMKYVPGMDSEEAVMAAVKEHSGTIGMVFVALIVLVLGIIIYKAMKKKK
jgi:membrane protein DedA with SNARE-associated domain